MKKKTFGYKLINIIVLLAAACIFLLNYSAHDLFRHVSTMQICGIVTTVIAVHLLKGLRLYFALYGADISLPQYMRTYCKVTPVSILFPFKLGELFRMYCYGVETGNMLKGVVTVILDRFMDTIALVTMIILIWFTDNGAMIPLVYILVVFLVCAVVVFLVFPGLYRYWKKYFLRADATPRKLGMLRLLDNMNRVYEEIASVSRGRGLILYVLSLLAWAVEMGSVAMAGKAMGERDIAGRLAAYLSSALSSSQAPELKQFVFISVIMMLAIYVVVKIFEGGRPERN